MYSFGYRNNYLSHRKVTQCVKYIIREKKFMVKYMKGSLTYKLKASYLQYIRMFKLVRYFQDKKLARVLRSLQGNL